MITDALVILESVGFLEREINRNFSLLEEAVNNNYTQDIPVLENRLQHLLAKIGDENHNMERYMAQYTKEVQDEKKAILSGVK